MLQDLSIDSSTRPNCSFNFSLAHLVVLIFFSIVAGVNASGQTWVRGLSQREARSVKGYRHKHYVESEVKNVKTELQARPMARRASCVLAGESQRRASDGRTIVSSQGLIVNLKK